MSVKEKDIQLLLGRLLRAGVVTSLLCALIGGLLYLYKSGHQQVNYKEFEYIIGQRVGFFQKGESLGIYAIKIGIIVLVLTPVARVIFSVIAFFLEKDYLYTFISFLVLLIMLCSMVYGLAG